MSVRLMADQSEPKRIPVPARAVASRLIQGTATLLHASRDEVERLNSVGSFIWEKLLEKQHDEAALSQAIVAEFEVDDATARVVLEAFLQSLAARDMVVYETRVDDT